MKLRVLLVGITLLLAPLGVARPTGATAGKVAPHADSPPGRADTAVGHVDSGRALGSGPVPLGGLDLDGYCRSQGDAGVSLDGATALDWDCQDAAGNRHRIYMNGACQWDYPDALGVYGHVYAQTDTVSDPKSWQCEGSGPGTVYLEQPYLDLGGFCRSQGSVVSLDGATALDWDCKDAGGGQHRIYMNAACQWEHPAESYVFGQTDNVADTFSWKCYGQAAAPPPTTTPTPRPTDTPTRTPTPKPPTPTATSRPTPVPSRPSLTLDGVVALNTRGTSQSWFRPGEAGYIRVTWTLRHVKRPVTTLAIERQYSIPSGGGWAPLKGGLVTHPVQAANGIGSEESPFFAPRHYRAYRISVRISFHRQWSRRRSVTVHVR